jgi:hypothetical protein
MEMGKLLDRLHEEEARERRAANNHELSKLVSASPDDKYDPNSGRRGGFAAAVAESGAKLNRKLEAEAIRDIENGQTEMEGSRRAFYAKYVPVLGRSRVDSLILDRRR